MNGFMKEERSNGHVVPPIASIGMFCKPLGNVPGEEV